MKIKQQVTKEQLTELSDPAKEKLAAWCHPRKYGKREIIDDKEVFFDLLTIGQMIEFLGQQKADNVLVQQEPSLNAQSVSYGYLISITDICDALWEAVKETLEK